MKILLFIFLSTFPCICFCQMDDVYGTPLKEKKYTKENLIIPTKDGRIFYEQVASCTDNRKELFLKARKWFVDTFKNAKSVLQMEDKEDGKLAGKAFYQYTFNNGISNSDVSIFFTLNIDIKDKKYRVQFYDMYGNNVNTNSLLNGVNMIAGAASSGMSGTPYVPNIQSVNYEVDYNKSLNDFLNGKRIKYNGKVLDGLQNGVKDLFASLEKIMKEPYNEDF
jgi:hypothetical protein